MEKSPQNPENKSTKSELDPMASVETEDSDFQHYVAEQEEHLSDIFSKERKGIRINLLNNEVATESLGEALKDIIKNWGEALANSKIGTEIRNVKLPEFKLHFDKNKILGSKATTFLIGMAGGAGVRYGVRQGLGLLTGGSGILLAGAGGAISGGIVEFGKTLHKELVRRRDIRASDERKVEELKNISKRLSAEKEPELKAKLSSYLEMVGNGVPQEFELHKQQMFEELKKELKIESIRWRKVAKGALIGAIVGGVGGLVGGYVSKYVENYFSPHDAQQTATGLNEAAKTAKDAGKSISKEAIKEKISGAAIDVSNKTLAAGSESLKEKLFQASLEKGQGVTHAARNLIHDYIVEQRSLGNNISLGKGQLVYAEDALRRTFEDGATPPGQIFEIVGSDIETTLNVAKNLTKEQLENLDKNWVTQISEKTWQGILDYGALHENANNFAETILNQAKEQMAEAAKNAATEAARQLTEAPAAAVVEEGKNSWLTYAFERYVTLGNVTRATAIVVAGGAGIATYVFKKEIKGAVKSIKAPLEFLQKKRETKEEETKKIATDPPRKFLKEEITYEHVQELVSTLNKSFGIYASTADLELSREEHYEGLKKLEEALHATPQALLDEVKTLGIQLGVGEPRIEQGGGINKDIPLIFIDPEMSIEDMKNYLKLEVEEVKKLKAST